MTIEVKSVPDRHHGFSFRTIRLRLRAAIRTGRNKLAPRLLTAAFILVAAATTYTLFNSYRYYSQIIDARLGHGYLTSRPGLYAAPTTLRPGQGISADQLVVKLRRAGYVESSDAKVWNGSFKRDSQSIEICSTLGREVTDTTPVQVIFNHDRIERLEQNGINLDSLTLEPEVLTNDPAAKFGEHHAITYDQIPPKLVQAILAIEDQRFFQHPGLDPFGVARALLRNAGNDRLGQGGSTITQQLVKNTYLTPERTFRRKYAEAMLAFAL
ncbi:MAG TPA: transglycosylase domain-containing protein, partial [Pyrinomonadaceae bacterium]